MKNRPITILILVLASAMTMQAQNNFSFSPQQPKPGDKISFTYTPPAGFVTDQSPLRCDAYKFGFYDEQMKYGGSPLQCELIHLKKKGDVYTGEITTDPETRFLAFAFTCGKVIFKPNQSGKLMVVSGNVDTNNDEGYSTLFYDDHGKELSRSNLLGATYYSASYFNNQAFENVKLARQMYEREIEIDSSARFICMSMIVPMLDRAQEPAESKRIAQAEIDRAFQNGMTNEQDYMTADRLSFYAGFKYGGSFFHRLGKEKFSNSDGLLGAFAARDGFYEEKELSKKETATKKLEQFYNSASWDVRFYAFSNITPAFFYQLYLSKLADAGRLDEVINYLNKSNLFPYTYFGMNSWRFISDPLIKKENKRVLELLDDQYRFVKSRWESLKAVPNQPSTDPSEDCMTTVNRMKEVTGRLAYLDNQYALYYYNTGEYKKGISYAEKAFELIQDGDFEYAYSSDINNTYFLLTEKVSPEKCRGLIEKFIAANCLIPEMTEKLKGVYINEHKSDEGFDKYYTSLLRSASKNGSERFSSLAVNKPAPKFSLTDLNGNTVTLESLKGKVVVLDFWATWCVPCVASFPAMSKLKDHYAGNKDVVFLFMDTWERNFLNTEELRNRIVGFLKERKFDFNVLLDTKGSAADVFGITHIPTKLIIDKQGTIRYKIADKEDDEYRLVEEMSAMIESIK